MSNDRTTASIGKVITDPTLQRDAIHIAVVPVVAGENLEPGESVQMNSEGKAASSGCAERDGVVDPYLDHIVRKGETFWLFLNPGSITSLRHDWTHPAFEPVSAPVIKANSAASEKWLREFANANDCPSYERMMAGLMGLHRDKDEFYDYGPDHGYDEYFTFMGVDAHCEVPDEFWYHFEIVTGVRPRHKYKYFNCSC